MSDRTIGDRKLISETCRLRFKTDHGHPSRYCPDTYALPVTVDRDYRVRNGDAQRLDGHGPDAGQTP